MSLARRRGVRETGLALLVAMLTLGLSSLLAQHPVLRALETESLDLRFKLRGPIAAGPDVALIMIDDRSLAAFGRWPLSRRLYADAVARLDRAGAKAIVFDMLFPEAEQPAPPAYRDAVAAALKALPASADAGLRANLARMTTDDPDGAFAHAMRTSGKVFLPLAFDFAGPARDPDYDLSDSGYMRFDPSPAKPVFDLSPLTVMTPIQRLGEAAAGLGHINWKNDADGVARYDYLALPFNGDFIPSLPVRAAAAYLGVAWSQVGLALGQAVDIGPVTVPTDLGMRFMINFPGPKGTVPTISFVDFMRGAMPADAFHSKIVLIGASYTGSNDSYPSPFGGALLPGTERLADSIDTIVNRRFITETLSTGWIAATIAITLLLAALSGGATAILPTRLSPLAGVTCVAIWCAIDQITFLHGLWLPAVGPVAALTVAMISALLFRYGVVEREGRHVRSAFRQYMAPALVDVLAAHPERLRLGGETRLMTFLFCDVRGFTAISEQFKSDPQGLIQLINAFLTPMTDVIMARGGTIDKYMGDCIMAFWNAPLDDPQHADHACASARAMIVALKDLNDRLRQEADNADRPFTPLAIGIGVNTGECVVGNMGSARRFDYSVLGDAVNLASRLEGQSKTYGVDIVIGETTLRHAQDWTVLELDLIAVKGKQEAVRIYTLLGDAALAATPAFRTLAANHAAMLSAYRARDWAGAAELLARCRHSGDQRLERLCDLYAERIALYRTAPPPGDWDGVFVAVSK